MELSIDIIVSLISLCGTILTVWSGNKLTQFRIQRLEEKVEKHNSVVERTMVLEEQMKVANHRISDLEEIEHEQGH